jgi:hypothetical protein
MNLDKIASLREELEGLRRGKHNLKSNDLTRFAGQLGRVPKIRGKEPTYVQPNIPGSRPISIPGHRKVNPYTASSIMDDFESDLDAFEAIETERIAREKQDKSKKLPPKALLQNRNTD